MVDVSHHIIENGKWFEEFSKPGNEHQSSLGEGFTVSFRVNSDELFTGQVSLLDLNFYVVPSVQLNYRKQAQHFIRLAKEDGKRVVIVTGCFDLITNAHIKLTGEQKRQATFW